MKSRRKFTTYFYKIGIYKWIQSMPLKSNYDSMEVSRIHIGQQTINIGSSKFFKITF